MKREWAGAVTLLLQIGRLHRQPLPVMLDGDDVDAASAGLEDQAIGAFQHFAQIVFGIFRYWPVGARLYRQALSAPRQTVHHASRTQR